MFRLLFSSLHRWLHDVGDMKTYTSVRVSYRISFEGRESNGMGADPICHLVYWWRLHGMITQWLRCSYLVLIHGRQGCFPQSGLQTLPMDHGECRRKVAKGEEVEAREEERRVWWMGLPLLVSWECNRWACDHACRHKQGWSKRFWTLMQLETAWKEKFL